ncbi:DUF4052 family protein [Alkalicoccobacillus gibsonii]|uniref:DUF4052 family protein n=1 Tax=Alkalicoccobacillus gibsonii TaxID=79881 RepID=A0ABU9VN53_9BACI
MNQVAAQLRIHASELVKGALIFWTILLTIIVVSYLIAFFGGVPDMFVVTNAPIIVFVAITAFRLVKEDLDYSIHLGLTRNRFALGSMVYILGISVLFNLFHQSILFIADTLQGSVLKDTLTFLSWSSILNNETSFILDFGLDLLLTVLVGFLLFFLASLLSRFGQLALYIVGLVSIVAMIVPAVNQKLFEMVMNFYHGTDLLFIWGMIGVLILLPLFSFFTLQKASA